MQRSQSVGDLSNERTAGFRTEADYMRAKSAALMAELGAAYQSADTWRAAWYRLFESYEALKRSCATTDGGAVRVSQAGVTNFAGEDSTLLGQFRLLTSDLPDNVSRDLAYD